MTIESRILAHQDDAGMRSTLGVFRADELVATVPPDDVYGLDTLAAVAARAGGSVEPFEVLLICPNHPTVSAVDCLTCVPED